MKMLNFSEIENTLDRAEMKQIMAGSGGGCGDKCHGADANCTGNTCIYCTGGGVIGDSSKCSSTP